jgi:thiol-disulfide isomerase/thioredoxin
MKTTEKKWTVFLLALTAVAVSALAEERTLKVGDPAPKLQNGKWVQGSQVKTFQPGKAYLVEFWATWCRPCRPAIAPLNRIYTKFKDKGLVVIGQDCLEQNDTLVEPFVKKMGDRMTYCVALDDKTNSVKGKMADTWLDAAGCNGIPSAFLIDTNGAVAWIGHPMELKQEIIEQVLAGKYDLRKAAADYEKDLKDQAEREKELAPARAAMTAVSCAMGERNWDEALDDLAEVEKLVPENRRASLEATFDMNRFRILLGKEDYPAAYKLAAKISDTHKDNPGLQNGLAWQMITDQTIEKPNLELAETLANRANEAAKGEDPGILETQARVLFMRGKKQEAVQAQTKAVALAEPEQKQVMQSRLDSYKKGELPAIDAPN